MVNKREGVAESLSLDDDVVASLLAAALLSVFVLFILID